MRRVLVRGGIVVALLASAAALPDGRAQRIDLREMPEAVSTVKTSVTGTNRIADPVRAHRS